MLIEMHLPQKSPMALAIHIISGSDITNIVHKEDPETAVGRAINILSDGLCIGLCINTLLK